ncbi:MAG TPA: discoidin domain-containing protein [Polyangiaceae bacterium]|nr:discoidin domain-containing protein [Polyangiaceae bacterium]
MKLAAVLLSLVWLSACSFPDYDAPKAGAGGSAGTGSVSSMPNCRDGERNGDETGIDCGMLACSKTCPAGQGCSGNEDCDGGACVDKICQAPSCTDELQNSDESDRDCGGEHGCDRCTVGQRCSATADCDGGQCASGLCRAPTCKDGLHNGSETDLDCGGDSCVPCGVGQICVEARDCDGVACTKGECQPAACDDEIWNQDETDRDCGGSCAVKCTDDQRCKIGADCQSGVCPKTQRCAAPTCNDGVMNGDEPTKDCGGSCSTKCVVLDACSSADDCADSSCIDERCLPETATGQLLSRLKWTARASHKATNSTYAEALDGDTNSYWTTGAQQAPAMWFEFDMQTEQVFFSIEIDCIRQADDFPDGIDVELSSDGTYSGAPAKSNLATKTGTTIISFTKPQVARYVRFTLTQGKSKWWSIDEIRVKQ